MIIAPYCFYVQRCRTSYLNPRQLTKHSRGIHNAWQFWFELTLVFMAQCFRLGGSVVHPLIGRYVKRGFIELRAFIKESIKDIMGGFMMRSWKLNMEKSFLNLVLNFL